MRTHTKPCFMPNCSSTVTCLKSVYGAQTHTHQVKCVLCDASGSICYSEEDARASWDSVIRVDEFKDLREGLIEAMEWNWLDADDPDVLEELEDLLDATAGVYNERRGETPEAEPVNVFSYPNDEVL